MDYEKIGIFIQSRRKELNMTQKDLALKLNITDKVISKWERGLGCPDVSLLGELSLALNVGIGEILNGEFNETLKDNTEFIKKAVDYSKKSTEINIYSRIKTILYTILCLLVISISINGINQIIFFNQNVDYTASQDLKEEVALFISNLDKLELKYDKFQPEYKEFLINSIYNTNLLEYNTKIRNYDLFDIEENIRNIYNFSYYLKNINDHRLEKYNLIISGNNIEHLNSISINNREYQSNLYDYSTIKQDLNDVDLINTVNGYASNLLYYLKEYNNLLDVIMESDINE